jgi:hypothetical protein
MQLQYQVQHHMPEQCNYSTDSKPRVDIALAMWQLELWRYRPFSTSDDTTVQL